MKNTEVVAISKEEFISLFDTYKKSNKPSFTEEQWKETAKEWLKYYKDITSPEGLKIEKWIKNEVDGYLPDYLGVKEKKFGGARIGCFDHVMIYLYTNSKDVSRNNKYIDMYASKGGQIKDCIDDEVNLHYNENIKKLLKEIVTAETYDRLYEVEGSELYKKFSAEGILKKIIILMSIMDKDDLGLQNDLEYKNGFLWIYDNKRIKLLADILGITDLKSSSLKNNNTVYTKAKEWAFEQVVSPSKEDYILLYDFLWDLSNIQSCADELTNFSSPNVIYHGAPGTGKTYGIIKEFAALKEVDSKTGTNLYRDLKYIQFHPSYTYQDFIEGVKPIGITDQGNLKLQVANGSFKDFCILVRKENEDFYKKNYIDKGIDVDLEHINLNDFADWPHYYFVVDEINRGNLSSIFGETFTLLEYRDYDFKSNYTEVKTNLVSTALSSLIKTVIGEQQKQESDLAYKIINGEVYFGIPFNIHFVGLMNDVDRSIDTFDLALRRRFKWIEKNCDYDVITKVLTDNNFSDVTIELYVKNCKELNRLICDTSYSSGLRLGKMYEIGHAFFLKIINTSKRKMLSKRAEEVFDNYIAGTLKEYIRQVAEEREIDGWLDNARKAFGIKNG